MGKPRVNHISESHNSSTSSIKKKKNKNRSESVSYSSSSSSEPWSSDEGGIDEYYELKEEEEAPDTYGPSGFMKVNLGETIEGYTVIRKTGFGNFSTVWLAYDLQKHKFVALKIAKAKENIAQIEQELLGHIRKQSPHHSGYDRVVHILDQFNIHRNTHSFPFPCTVFEPLGSSLLSKLYKSRTGIELPAIQKIARQMFQALQYLHEECNLVHTDIKPENVLVTMPTQRMYEITKKVMDDKFTGKGVGYNAAEKQKIGPREIKKLTKIYTEICSHAIELDPSKIAQSGEAFQGALERADEVEDWEIEDYEMDDNNNKDNKNLLCGEVQKLLLNIKYSCGYAFPSNIKGTDFDRFKHNEKRLEVFKEIMDPAVNIKIIDIGCATYIDKAAKSVISTLEYRAPEVISEVLFTPAADIWSTACMLFELTTSHYLIKTDSELKKSLEEQLYEKMIECLGPIPGKLYAGGKKYNQYFDSNGNYFKKVKAGQNVLTRLMSYGYSKAEVLEYSKLLNAMLDFDYKKRPSASQCLQHPWLKTYLT